MTQANNKSPFLVVDDFISAALCECMIDELPFKEPDTDTTGNPLVSVCNDDDYQKLIYDKFERLIPKIDQHYGTHHKATTRFNFEWLSQGGIIPVHAENSEYIDNSWVMTQQRDLSVVLFLTDYNQNTDFDLDFECHGGKLEFLNHKFGFNPSRGTLIVFPSDPRFCNASSRVAAGDLYQLRFHLISEGPFVYDPKDFPGDFTTWF